VLTSSPNERTLVNATLVRALPHSLAAIAAGLVASTLSLSLVSLLVITALLAFTTWRGRLFGVEGYVCILGLYYWLGLANPFRANVHGVTLTPSTVETLVALVFAGTALLLVGARAGRGLVGKVSGTGAPMTRQEDAATPLLLRRLYRASFTCLFLGTAVAIACYARFGIPALANEPDSARAEFISRLSPFTYYQWLFIEVGFALAAVTIARDRVEFERTRRLALIGACAAVLVIIGGVSSRVTIGTPLVIAAVAWWSQGRRFAWPVVLLGIAAVAVLVGVVWLYRIQAIGGVTLYGVDFDVGAGPSAGFRSVAAALSIFARTSVETFGLFVQGFLPKLHGEVSLMSIISLLPGRHPGLGLFRISEMLGYNAQAGTTVSLFGGMYADFGLAGIIVAAPLVGLLLGVLERRAQEGDGLVGVYYAIALAYYINMTYGGQLLDVSLLWKLWLGAILVRYCRFGRVTYSRLTTGHVISTVALYLYGAGLLLLS
jgi:putative O-antigen polymerase